MNNTNKIENEINAIRVDIYNETKDLSLDKRRERYQKMRERLEQTYNFKYVKKNIETRR